MMTQAFYTGLAGIKTYQTAIDVTSDNIANLSTVGYRSYSAEFSSLFEEDTNTQSLKTSVDSSVGIGTRVSTTSMDMGNDGSLELTDRNTDLAIYGNGWFGLEANGETMFTRAGNFTFDENSDLVTTSGAYVLGTLADNIDANDVLTKVIDEIQLSDITAQQKLTFPKQLTYPAEATTEVRFMANLGVEDTIQTIGAGVVDPTGIKNDLRLEFKKSAIQIAPGTQWDVTATVKTLDGETTYDTQTGVVKFDEKGGLISSTLAKINNNGSAINLDLGTGYDGVVSTTTDAISSSSISNGIIKGDLQGYAINKNAEIIATFTNGMQSSVGKVALYHFQNDQGLNRSGASTFQASANSGEPIFYQDENGNNILGAEVKNYQLESSNVRLEVALTELIVYQRSYEANAKSITTAHEMIQKALEMDA